MPTIRWLGHACFTLEQGKDLLVFDPFIKENPSLAQKPNLKPTLVLVTHGHFDHLGDALDIAQASGATIHTTPELAGYCSSKGAQATGSHMGGTVKYDFGWVKLVPAFHSSSLPDGTTVGNPVGMVVRFHGLTFYHAGDTCVFGDMKLIGELTPVDVAYLPVGDYFTMGIDEAVKATELLQPKVVIPGHFATWPLLNPDAQQFKQKVEARTKAKCVILKPGETYQP
ncbi:MAG: metal-dependent hydrolase [Chloroflexi bacterium]|nr:metal-dependent hydrolase [Chloroflexota bacterium]